MWDTDMAWWQLVDRGPSGGVIVSEAPTSDVLMSWELPAPSGPGHAPVLSPCRADTALGAPGPELWTGLLTVTCYLSLGSGDYVWPGQPRQWPSHPDGERRVLTGSPPLNPHRLNVTSDWPDLYLLADLVTLLISFWERRSSFLDRRFQCGSHVWCTVIILDYSRMVLSLWCDDAGGQLGECGYNEQVTQWARLHHGSTPETMSLFVCYEDPISPRV